MTSADFQALVAPHRGALHAHCYRMLGSIADADDALQDALIGAWKGNEGFEGRAKLRSWLFTIATNASLAIIAKRKHASKARAPAEHASEVRTMSADDHSNAAHTMSADDQSRSMAPTRGPASSTTDVGPMMTEPIWIEPYPEDPFAREGDAFDLLARDGNTSDPRARLESRENVELAFIAALQNLPATQRAVVLLRDVLDYSADETAAALETSVASANSALQRARETLASRAPAKSQQATLREMGDAAQRDLVTAFVSAWERADVTALSALLARDAKFSMPPIPTWFDGADAITRFFAERVFATPWKLVPMRANGQLAFACYQQGAPGTTATAFGIGALAVIDVRDGKIAELVGFLDPAVHARFSIPPAISAP